MATSNIFNAANRLKNYNVVIGSITLVKEVIISVEMAYSNNTPRLMCNMFIKDLYDLNLWFDWKDIEVSISYTDVFDENVEKKFKIINIKENYNDNHEKIIEFEMQDVFSYTLMKSYTCKSFPSGDIGLAIKEYITELGIIDYAGELDFSSCETETPFVIPLHINNLEWIEKELVKYGFLMYQTKSGISMKGYDDLIPSNFKENDSEKPYMDGTSNQLYKNKIYELIPKNFQRKNTPPITRGIAYDPLLKKMVYSDDVNILDDFVLNDDDSNLQENNSPGIRDVYQTHLDFNKLKLQMRESFMKQYEMAMVVNGYAKNDLNQIYDLKLRGIKSSLDSQNKGNMILSGKWVSYKVVDKIIGDCLIQKITLNRADSVKRA